MVKKKKMGVLKMSKDKVEYVFTEDEIKICLKANGWTELFVENSWNEKYKGGYNDFGGCDTLTAFKVLLRRANLR